MMKMRLVSILLLFSLITLPRAQIFAQSEPAVHSDSKGIVIGRVLKKGGSPLAGGMVFFYEALIGTSPKDQTNRVPAIKIDIAGDGKFSAELPAGKYHMKVVKRMSAEKTVQDGDYVYLGLDDKGNAKEYILRSGEILDIGIIPDVGPYKKSKDVIKTAVEGVIHDEQGKPVEGVKVFAFLDATTTRRPLFFSNKTGADGKYILSLPAGAYYLRVRDKMKGGSPDVGQMVGMFGGEIPAVVTVADGEIKKGIDITVRRFVGKGPGSGINPMPGVQQQGSSLQLQLQ